jgi:hypothetical protein
MQVSQYHEIQGSRTTKCAQYIKYENVQAYQIDTTQKNIGRCSEELPEHGLVNRPAEK